MVRWSWRYALCVSTTKFLFFFFSICPTKQRKYVWRENFYYSIGLMSTQNFNFNPTKKITYFFPKARTRTYPWTLIFKWIMMVFRIIPNFASYPFYTYKIWWETAFIFFYILFIRMLMLKIHSWASHFVMTQLQFVIPKRIRRSHHHILWFNVDLYQMPIQMMYIQIHTHNLFKTESILFLRR